MNNPNKLIDQDPERLKVLKLVGELFEQHEIATSEIAFEDVPVDVDKDCDN